MAERPKPYIGISGVVNQEQERMLVSTFRELGLSERRNIALGVKAVHKTQYEDIPNTYGEEWYPVGAEKFSAPIVGNTKYPEVIGVAQLYLDIDHVEDPRYRTEFMQKILSRGEKWLDGLQFDRLPWHIRPEMLAFIERLKNDSGKIVLLQAHQETMNTFGPKRLAARLGEYANAIDYILLDTSHGRGIPMSPEVLLPYVEALYNEPALTNVGVGTAGGLDAQGVEHGLSRLVAEYPDLSWDAEAKLHPINECDKRPLDMNVAQKYLEASMAMVCE